MSDLQARAVAFYLPQFHPIPQNDEWWGPGFTEWTNTASARALFRGHVQPHIPADLGFYDLRLAASREAQSTLAQQYGVEAFCYWHYWFGDGRRILERPFSEVVASGEPSVKFCLGWANQTWTGIWHGASNRVLMEQRYPGPEDERAHFETVLPAFRDERYFRVDDKPVFYVFRPEELPSASAFVDRWQDMARAAGLPGLYLVAEVSDLGNKGARYTRHVADGFDAAVYMRLPYERTRVAETRMRLGRKLFRHPEVWPYARNPLPWPPEGVDPENLQPCVYPNWDNSPRSGRRGVVLTGSTPERFRTHVRNAVDALADRPPQERLLWVKSWNEWAEGNYLEPDRETGHARLEVLSKELRRG